MKKTAAAIILILFVFALGAQGTMEDQQYTAVEAPDPQEIPDLDDPVGREVARYGTDETYSGKLFYSHGEWHLEADEIIYELHMGPTGHDAEDLFEENSPAVVRGFVYKDHIAPILIESTTGDISFWNEGRFSRWAGSGERVQQADQQGLRAVDEPYQQRVTVQGERGNPLPNQQDLRQNLFQRDQ